MKEKIKSERVDVVVILIGGAIFSVGLVVLFILGHAVDLLLGAIYMSLFG